MLGPLFAIAALRVSGVEIGVPVQVRYTGQWVIGTALGLYFTPAVIRQVAAVWYLPILAAAFAIAIGYVAAALLARLARLDLTTSLFASVPGGAAEMTTLGERFGELRAQVMDVWRRANTATDGSLRIPQEYLVSIVRL